jgi:hypothetical protein
LFQSDIRLFGFHPKRPGGVCVGDHESQSRDPKNAIIIERDWLVDGISPF